MANIIQNILENRELLWKATEEDLVVAAKEASIEKIELLLEKIADDAWIKQHSDKEILLLVKQVIVLLPANMPNKAVQLFLDAVNRVYPPPDESLAAYMFLHNRPYFEQIMRAEFHCSDAALPLKIVELVLWKNPTFVADSLISEYLSSTQNEPDALFELLLTQRSLRNVCAFIDTYEIQYGRDLLVAYMQKNGCKLVRWAAWKPEFTKQLIEFLKGKQIEISSFVFLPDPIDWKFLLNDFRDFHAVIHELPLERVQQIFDSLKREVSFQVLEYYGRGSGEEAVNNFLQILESRGLTVMDIFMELRRRDVI